MYSKFEIPKKNGDPRVIESPNEELKFIQRKLLDEFMKYEIKLSKEKNIKRNISHGFTRNKSIISNAKVHLNKRFVVNIDLADFFHSIHFGRVVGFFEKNYDFQLPHEVAVFLAQLTTYQGRLPQGAPTSPYISNLICNIFDMRILRIAKKFRMDYTRYADDLTFSTNDKFFLVLEEDFMEEIYGEIKKFGFNVNPDKTRVQYKHSRQDVTGVIVNEKLNASKKFIKHTRSMAHSLYTKGEYYINGEKGTLNQLEGRFAFINQLDYENNRIEFANKFNNSKEHKKLLEQKQLLKIKKDHQRKFSDGLNSREKQYQKFLFYKYFYANEKPLILTEGKTDIRYIKAALKKHAKSYPSLITQDNKGNYEFKVMFLKRSKRLRYFLNLHLDGANALKNICSFYINDNKLYPNYNNYFKETTKKLAKNPVIMVFDNEKNKNKPLNILLNHVNLKQSNINEDLSVNVKDNLFFLTHKNVTTNDDSEIEDLFSHSVLKTTLEGRAFSRKESYDINKYYGKEIFSNYIYNHYKEIDFSHFTSFLDVLDEIITSWKNSD